jgi:hypothetical protein
MRDGLTIDIRTVYVAKSEIRSQQSIYNYSLREKGVEEVVLIPVAQD